MLLLFNSFLQTPLVVLMDIYFEIMRTLVVVTILYTVNDLINAHSQKKRLLSNKRPPYAVKLVLNAPL